MDFLRTDAAEKLRTYKSGTYLVRPRNEQNIPYALSIM